MAALIIREFPHLVGVLPRQTCLALATRAIDGLGERKRSLNGTFVVSLDPAGRVWLDWATNVDTLTYVATINRKSNPAWLADEIEHEWRDRSLF